MCDRPTPKAIWLFSRRRRETGRLAALVLIIGLAGGWMGCSSQSRYRVMSVFFDGVPDPNAKPVAVAQEQQGTTAKPTGPTISIHKPYADQKCEACHEGGAQQALSFQASSSLKNSNVCMKCHEPVPRQHRFMHAPVAAKACLFCHSPHEAQQPHLLSANQPDLCTQCHDPALLRKTVPEHQDPQSQCLVCHFGHGSDNPRYFLRPTAPALSAPPPATRTAVKSLPASRPAPTTRPAVRAAPSTKPVIRQAPSTRPTTRPVATTRPTPRSLPTSRPTTRASPRAVPTTCPTTRPTTRPSPVSPRPEGDRSRERSPSGRGETGDKPNATADGGFLSERPLYLADVTQEGEGPVVIGAPRKTEFFHLDPVDAAAEVRYRYEHDTTDPKTGPNESFTENRFEEDLTLKSHAYIIHPNLVDINLSGTFGLRQDPISENGRSEYGRETIYDYDVRGVILQKEEAPVTLYSRRTSDLISRQFGASFDNTLTTSGAIIDWRNKQVPLRLEVYHSEESQTALDQSEAYTLSQNVANIGGSFSPDAHQHVTLSCTFSTVDENSNFSGTRTGGSTSDSFVTNDVEAAHLWEFGPQQHNTLSSSVSYFDQTGDFPYERLRVNELLRLKHSDTFETRYRYALDYQSSNYSNLGTVDQTQNTFDAGFIHRLYKSLITSGDAGIRELDRSDHSSVSEYFANVNFEYHKLVPYGAFTLDTGYGFDRQENRNQTSVTHVVNESRTFTDPEPITLTGTNIISGTLLVRSANGIIVYNEGIDYLVRTFTDRVEIERVVGGRIANGQTVLLSYDLSPQPGNTSTNNIYHLSLRYDIDQGALTGLSLYGRYTRLYQDIATSSTTYVFIPNSYEDIVAGGEYRFLSVTVGAEQQYHHSAISPYDATRFFGRSQRRVGLDSTLLLNATYTIYQYPEAHDRVALLNLAANLSHRFSSILTGSAGLSYLNQHDQRFGTTSGVDGNVELRWNIRQTSIVAQFRQALLDTSSQRNTYQTIYFGLRREF